MDIETPSQWDIDGHQHYFLDSSLSTKYIMEHCTVSANEEFCTTEEFSTTKDDSQPLKGYPDIASDLD